MGVCRAWLLYAVGVQVFAVFVHVYDVFVHMDEDVVHMDEDIVQRILRKPITPRISGMA